MTNPELDQDRAFDLYDTYKKYGYVMFPQQRRIYEQLAKLLIIGKTVLEVGCGNGVGTAVLVEALQIEVDQPPNPGSVVGTDKIQGNVEFAKCLYPWIDFRVWDVLTPWKHGKRRTVVVVEVIEHVADPMAALRNMIDAATEAVWISTPNGKYAKKPPENPHHVAEYTVDEMWIMLRSCGMTKIDVLAWDDFRHLSPDTDVTPLVYKVEL